MKVIGLTGTIGSGKEVVKDFIKKKYNCYYVTLSDILKSEIEKRKGTLSRTTLQDIGNEMRKKYGNHILAMLAVEYLGRDKEAIIIDGIRHAAEIEYLKKKFGGDFKLIAVDAPQEVRFQRIVDRGRDDPKAWGEFVKTDERDQGIGEEEHGLHVKDCVERADFLIVNDSTLEELEKKVNDVLTNIF
ncbi:MAG: AAA family ATPase [Candidatus Aenigmarchaeota archaeon]|nr:AAA family ATPase [Candidatus Aenigmarchaeota archaeon]